MSGDTDDLMSYDVLFYVKVLVSIQGLIFVPEPVFNEPGDEQSIGTLEGQQKSSMYNSSIKRVLS
jgi:hypothetical protein